MAYSVEAFYYLAIEFMGEANITISIAFVTTVNKPLTHNTTLVIRPTQFVLQRWVVHVLFFGLSIHLYEN